MANAFMTWRQRRKLKKEEARKAAEIKANDNTAAKSRNNPNSENPDSQSYGEFTLKYDKNVNDDIDKFYSCGIFSNASRSEFYFKKLHRRYIERLRERFFDTFVLFLLEIRTIQNADLLILQKHISSLGTYQAYDLAAKINSYTAWIEPKVADKYNVMVLLRSLLSYDSKIIIVTEDKIFIHSNFFKYVNELLWSRNSQYSNYGLSYTDYDIDEEGL